MARKISANPSAKRPVAIQALRENTHSHAHFTAFCCPIILISTIRTRNPRQQCRPSESFILSISSFATIASIYNVIIIIIQIPFFFHFHQYQLLPFQISQLANCQIIIQLFFFFIPLPRAMMSLPLGLGSRFIINLLEKRSDSCFRKDG